MIKRKHHDCLNNQQSPVSLFKSNSVHDPSPRKPAASIKKRTKRPNKSKKPVVINLGPSKHFKTISNKVTRNDREKRHAQHIPESFASKSLLNTELFTY